MSVQVPAVQRVVLVEGPSDAAVLRVLADARGRSLEDEGVDVISMGGATNIGHYLRRFGPRGRRLILAGLCDAREERFFRRALQGEGSRPERATRWRGKGSTCATSTWKTSF